MNLLIHEDFHCLWYFDHSNRRTRMIFEKPDEMWNEADGHVNKKKYKKQRKV